MGTVETRATDAPPRRGISDNAKWIVVTLVIPLTTWLVGEWQERVATIRADSAAEIERARQVEESRIADARSDVSAMTALLPALADRTSNDPASQPRY
jgi:hypothetical protein